MRPVFTNPRFSLLSLFYPPYTGRQNSLIDLLIKWMR
jgi:hypothetical protein